ncbi:hypothetical protein JKP88DRAFT_267901, partial [Tribonema minus]
MILRSLLLVVAAAEAFLVPAGPCSVAGAAPGFITSKLHATAAVDLSGAVALVLESVDTRQIPAENVVQALESLEQKAQAVRQQDVDGLNWELVFSSQLSKGYMPVREVICFDISNGKISLSTTFGPGIPLGGIQGTCSWQEPEGSQPGVVSFNLSKVLLGPIAFEKPGAKEAPPKTYSFFFSGDGVLAARSSNGGVAVLKKV